MAPLTIAFLGDIVGAPGRMAVQQQLPRLRQEHGVDLVIANAENARSGSGLSPELYRKLRSYGIDAITLGDHVYRDAKIAAILEQAGEPIARPANLASKAVGQQVIRVAVPASASGATGSVFVLTVLGRLFMSLPADDPFACADRLLASLPEANAIVIVEAHMEATSEKIALAHYLDGRVTAVIGTHTHVPTADARILRNGTAFITDVGMCGPYHSIIGRDPAAVLRFMTTGFPTRFEVGSGGETMSGAVIRIDRDTGRAKSINLIQYVADLSRPPFV
jgi:metallophosphoesterase (TIGR00282 family)